MIANCEDEKKKKFSENELRFEAESRMKIRREAEKNKELQKGRQVRVNLRSFTEHNLEGLNKNLSYQADKRYPMIIFPEQRENYLKQQENNFALLESASPEVTAFKKIEFNLNSEKLRHTSHNSNPDSNYLNYIYNKNLNYTSGGVSGEQKGNYTPVFMPTACFYAYYLPDFNNSYYSFNKLQNNPYSKEDILSNPHNATNHFQINSSSSNPPIYSKPNFIKS